MCGLVGAAGSLTFAHENAFKLMLQMDTLRGPHSTGVLIVPRQANPTPLLAKELGTPWDGLFDNDDYKKGMRGVTKLLLGHNRFATKGNITADNAHPFEFDNVIGAHNGTLRTVHQLKGHEKFEVDSQSLYSHLSEHGAKETVNKLNGAFALTWYDKEADTLNICRNTQRPLWWCRTKDNKAIFWASEKWMLIVALGKHKIDCEDAVEIQPLMHYTFNLADLSFVDMAKPRVSQLKEWSFQQGFRGWDDYPPDEVYGNRYPNYRPPAYRPPAQGNSPFPVPVVDKAPSEQLPAAVSPELTGKQVSISFREAIPRQRSGNGAPYIRCVLTNSPTIEVRAYLHVTDKRWDKLARQGGSAVGKVKKISHVGGSHAVIDIRSLTVRDNIIPFKRKPEVIDLTPMADDTPAEEYVPVYEGGTMVDIKTFDDLTAKGCCICGGDVGAADAEDIAWICNNEAFICPGCTDTPIGKEYAASM